MAGGAGAFPAWLKGPFLPSGFYWSTTLPARKDFLKHLWGNPYVWSGFYVGGLASEEPLFMREHSSDHRFAVSMRDLAAANGLFLSEGQERQVCCELVWSGAPEDWGWAVFAGLKDVRLCAEPVLYA